MAILNAYYYEIISLSLVSVVVLLLYCLYWRIEAGQAYVRTGWGKPKVLLERGAFVIPLLHTLTPINLRTYHVEVELFGKQALVTNDPLRMDVVFAFNVRITPELPQILLASRALSAGNLSEGRLRIILEAEATAVLRNIGASMSVEAIHQRRYEFTDWVSKRLVPPLQQYGLELVSLNLVSLEQTDKGYYDPQQLLDAKGLALLERLQAERKPYVAAVSDVAVMPPRRTVALQLVENA